MAKKNKEWYTLDEIQDEFVGKRGTPNREKFEYELQMQILGDLICKARKMKNLTQEQLGEQMGVKKSWISKLEKGDANLSMETIMKVVKALGAKIILRFEMGGKNVEVA
jgi:HTH-type transcriptional regulator / antitoxin HipB